MKNKFFKELLQWVEAIAIAIVLAILIRGFLFEPVIIEGRSMLDTLHDGDRVILNKITLAFNEPDYGDIVVIEIEEPYFKNLDFLNNSKVAKRLLPTTTGADYIKRVIAKEGDIVNVKNGYVYVNDVKLEELYTRADGTTLASSVNMPYTVGEGMYFVMGDNRIESRDSRAFGAVSEDQIIGKTIIRVWPLYSLGKIDKAE